jgi:hypothetical protein
MLTLMAAVGLAGFGAWRSASARRAAVVSLLYATHRSAHDRAGGSTPFDDGILTPHGGYV